VTVNVKKGTQYQYFGSPHNTDDRDNSAVVSMPECGGYGMLAVKDGFKPLKIVYEPLDETNVYNYPNPFSGSTTIRFSLDMRQKVKISIMDINGNPVWLKILEESRTYRGINTLLWEGINDRGNPVSNGVYILRITAGEKTAVKKIVIIR